MPAHEMMDSGPLAAYPPQNRSAARVPANTWLSYIRSFPMAAHHTSFSLQFVKRLARVQSDGKWQTVPAKELVPGDIIYLRVGDVIPADVWLAAGQLFVDQTALTGESLPVDLEPGSTAYAGTALKRGEATGEVTATGASTFFGKTAELVRTAKTASHLERIILQIVQYMVGLDALLLFAVLGYAVVMHISLDQILPFALVLLIASVPVALPATFTLTTSLGAQKLAKSGILVTRLSAGISVRLTNHS